MKISKADAGRLGSIASLKTQYENKLKRIEEYNAKPKLCLNCNNKIEYHKKINKFCCSSCSASYNNIRKTKKDYGNCIICNKNLTRKGKIYCSKVCQNQNQLIKKIDLWLNKNHNISSRVIKKYIIKENGYICSECGLTNWNNKDIILELEHKDGNSENNNLENLCLLCPNCHSQTSTYKSKNKGNGRYERRKRYIEGKSY